MARLLLSKATLSAQRRQLAAYRRFLPSLEMKRQQLMVTVKQCQQTIARQQAELQRIRDKVQLDYPMLANDRIGLHSLARDEQVVTRRVNIVGVWVEKIEQVRLACAPISILTRPHWTDGLQALLKQALTLESERRQQQKIADVLQQELVKVTQRVNLFDKVLIPQTLKNIRKIQIYLDDKDREAVITSKIAKGKRQADNTAQSAGPAL